MGKQDIDSLDGVLAAPRFHRVLLENDAVRVLDTIVQPGETVPLHTHRWAAVLYVVTWSECVRRDVDGNITMDSRASVAPISGAALWSGPVPAHTLENVGDRELRVIAIEQKQPLPAQP